MSKRSVRLAKLVHNEICEERGIKPWPYVEDAVVRAMKHVEPVLVALERAYPRIRTDYEEGCKCDLCKLSKAFNKLEKSIQP